MQDWVGFEFAHPFELRFVQSDNCIVRAIEQRILDGRARQIPCEYSEGAGWDPEVFLKAVPLGAKLHS